MPPIPQSGLGSLVISLAKHRVLVARKTDIWWFPRPIYRGRRRKIWHQNTGWLGRRLAIDGSLFWRGRASEFVRHYLGIWVRNKPFLPNRDTEKRRWADLGRWSCLGFPGSALVCPKAGFWREMTFCAFPRRLRNMIDSSYPGKEEIKFQKSIRLFPLVLLFMSFEHDRQFVWWNVVINKRGISNRGNFFSPPLFRRRICISHATKEKKKERRSHERFMRNNFFTTFPRYNLLCE